MVDDVEWARAGRRVKKVWDNAPYTPAVPLVSTNILLLNVFNLLKNGRLALLRAKVPESSKQPDAGGTLMVENKTEIWTIGHSTHSLEEFVAALQSFEIKVLADVRSFPGSRRYPQFNQAELANSLPAVGIEYQHLRELGGRRRARKDSVNIAWRNEGFRGYADYMDTDGFREGIARLLELAATHRTAIMCAEALWWRCHRSLISDYLKVRNIEVMHIQGEGKSEPHPFTSAAQIVDGSLSYRGLLGVED